jgi:hypothetical protein
LLANTQEAPEGNSPIRKTSLLIDFSFGQTSDYAKRWHGCADGILPERDNTEEGVLRGR